MQGTKAKKKDEVDGAPCFSAHKLLGPDPPQQNMQEMSST